MLNINFKNKSVNNPQRKKIKILSQTPDEIIADVDFAETVEEEGTAITAEIMNSFQTAINNIETTSSTAQTQSSQALQIANAASTNANQAINDVDVLDGLVQEAKSKAEEALAQVVEKQGSKIYTNGSYVSTFETTDKVDATTYQAAISNIQSQISQINTLITKLGEEVLGYVFTQSGTSPIEDIPGDIKDLAQKRWNAKLAKDWAVADELRKEIEAKGYEIKDSKDNYQIIKK